jgi:GxxExxY protein
MNRLRIISPLPADLEMLVNQTIGALLEVHRERGPGLAEGVYSRACTIELGIRGIPFEAEKSIPVMYRGRFLCHHRLDLLVDGRLIVELKSVERIHPVHVAQVVSYLRVTGARLGLIANFNIPVLKDGIRRVIL